DSSDRLGYPRSHRERRLSLKWTRRAPLALSASFFGLGFWSFDSAKGLWKEGYGCYGYEAPGDPPTQRREPSELRRRLEGRGRDSFLSSRDVWLCPGSPEHRSLRHSCLSITRV